MSSLNKLLKEYITLLVEEDGGGDGGYGGYGDYGGLGGIPNNAWGFMDYGGPLSDIFIKPFTNIFNIAKAGVKEIGIRLKTALKVVLEVALTTIIPWMETDFRKIFDTQRQELRKFKQEHAELFKQNMLGFSNDAKLLAFMASPNLYITAGLIRKSPETVVRMVDSIRDSHASWIEEWEVIKHRVMLPFDPYAQKTSKSIAGRRHYSMVRKHYAHGYRPEDVPQVEEALNPQQRKLTPQEEMANFLKRPDVVQDLNSSQTSQQLKKEGEAVLKSINISLLKSITKVLNIKSVQDIEHLTGKRISDKFVNLTPQERQKAEQIVVQQVHSAVKSFYIKNITAQIENIKRDGVDPNNIYIQTLNNILNKIKSM
jgi:hypothetical protein